MRWKLPDDPPRFRYSKEADRLYEVNSQQELLKELFKGIEKLNPEYFQKLVRVVIAKELVQDVFGKMPGE